MSNNDNNKTSSNQLNAISDQGRTMKHETRNFIQKVLIEMEKNHKIF